MTGFLVGVLVVLAVGGYLLYRYFGKQKLAALAATEAQAAANKVATVVTNEAKKL